MQSLDCSYFSYFIIHLLLISYTHKLHHKNLQKIILIIMTRHLLRYKIFVFDILNLSKIIIQGTGSTPIINQIQNVLTLIHNFFVFALEFSVLSPGQPAYITKNT